MHYYKRNLGDYAKKAGRLSMLQHGSYTLLIDACYDREQFPTCSEAMDWTWASSTAEIEAVEFVLGKFFTLEDGRYVQTRIRDELAEYHGKAATNKRIADERETKRRENSTNRARTVNEPPPNHEPVTMNQEPFVAPKALRAARLPTNFEPTPEPEAEAGIDRRLELAKFHDFWAAKGGKDGCKLDWQATWRNWSRNARRPIGSQPSQTVVGKPGRDPELERLERDSANAAPIPSAIREKLKALKHMGVH